MTDQRGKIAAALKWASFALLSLCGAMAYDGDYLLLDSIGAGIAVLFLVIWDRLVRD